MAIVSSIIISIRFQDPHLTNQNNINRNMSYVINLKSKNIIEMMNTKGISFIMLNIRKNIKYQENLISQNPLKFGKIRKVIKSEWLKLRPISPKSTQILELSGFEVVKVVEVQIQRYHPKGVQKCVTSWYHPKNGLYA